MRTRSTRMRAYTLAPASTASRKYVTAVDCFVPYAQPKPQ